MNFTTRDNSRSDNQRTRIIKNHLGIKVIFLFLLVGVCFPQSTLLLDANLAIRYTVAHALFLVLLLFIPAFRLERWHGWLVLFYGFSLCSTGWSLGPSEALFDAQRVLIGVLVIGLVSHLLAKGQEKFIARTVLWLAVAVLLVNLGGYLGAQVKGWPFASTSAHPNLLASLLFLFMVLLLYFRRLFARKERHFLHAVLVGLIGVLLSLQVRSVLLALLVFGVLLALWKLPIFRKRKVAVALLVVGIGAVAAMPFLPASLFDSTTLNERVFMWEKTSLLIQENPLLGVGAGNWQLNFTKHGVAGFDTFEIYGLRMQRPHNDFLWVLSETGVLGFLLVATFFIHLFVRWFRAPNRSATTVLLLGLIAFAVVSFFSFPRERMEHIVLFFVLVACLSQASVQQSSVRQLNAKWLLVAPVLFGLVIGLFRIKGEYHGRQVLEASRQKAHQTTTDHALTAQSVFYQYIGGDTPISAYLAEAALRQQKKADFLRWSADAYQRAPFNYEVASNYGMALNTQGEYNEALTVLETAHAINPRFDGAILNLAIVNYNLQRYETAKVWIDKVHFKSEITDYYAGLIQERLLE